MNHFGCRDDFAIEVGDQLDPTGHCLLDIYAKGIRLTRLDNRAYVGIAHHHWPRRLFSTEEWNATDIYWDVPFSTSPEELLKKVLVENEYFQRHLTFDIGSLAIPFTVLAFGRPADFVLLIVRNDPCFVDDDSDLPAWNALPQADEAPIHWLSLTLPRQEFEHICMGAYACLTELHSKIPPVIYLMREEKLVYDAIGSDGAYLNDIITAAGLPAATVSWKLEALEMRQLIKILPGKKHVRLV
ncbi:MAG: hypothetical protein ACO1TE_03775 [Prosthecobacter sp.]